MATHYHELNLPRSYFSKENMSFYCVLIHHMKTLFAQLDAEPARDLEGRSNLAAKRVDGVGLTHAHFPYLIGAGCAERIIENVATREAKNGKRSNPCIFYISHEKSNMCAPARV